MASFYILRLKSGGLYVGATTDMERRYGEHCSGRACRTTQVDPPVKLLCFEEFDTLIEARKRDAQLKKWSRAKKKALVAGDFRSLKSLEAWVQT